jgi:chaperonin GroES
MDNVAGISTQWRGVLTMGESLQTLGFGSATTGDAQHGAKTTKERAGMKLRPLNDRVIVKRLEEEEKTVGGIIIPDTAKEKPQQARVIAVGKGRTLDNGQVIPLTVKEGDRVLFGKYAGTEIKIDGDEHLIMREDDILAILQ